MTRETAAHFNFDLSCTANRRGLIEKESPDVNVGVGDLCKSKLEHRLVVHAWRFNDGNHEGFCCLHLKHEVIGAR